MSATTTTTPQTLQIKAVELCKLALQMTTQAGSGHPSSALSLAHIVVELMYHEMRFDPSDPWNPASDRLVLSEGHAVPIVYAAYADLGGIVGTRQKRRRLTRDDLLTLRKLDSVLDGHPNPAEGFPFFDAATGSLGQGLSAAAGLALAARLDGIDKRIFVLVGDGESREGQIWEAMDFVAEKGLRNICVVFNCNGQGQAGDVSDQQTPEMIRAKATAFGWEAVTLNGHDPQQVSSILSRAGKGEKPLAAVARTVKGWGVPLLQSGNYHGKPLTQDQLAAALAQLDETLASLAADDDEPIATRQAMPSAPVEPAVKSAPVRLPDFATGLKRVGLEAALAKKRLATRVAYGAALVSLGDVDARVVSLDADVSNSTYANFFAERHPERFFECKIAEQNMVTAAVGLSAAGKIPFVSSFAKFLARAYDQVEMAAITRANVKLVGSHSGVSLGADGPSQMSLPDVAYFRSMTRADNGRGEPVCRVFQPSDAVSAYACVELMASSPSLAYMRTHRPDAPFLYAPAERFDLSGWKRLRQGKSLTLVSSGYTVHTALKAAEELERDGVSCNVFDVYAFPLDASAILDAARGCGGTILTVEDNYIGGLHAELAEAVAACGCGSRPGSASLRVIGLTCGRLPKSALSAEEVFAYTGVGVEDIKQAARQATATIQAGTRKE